MLPVQASQIGYAPTTLSPASATLVCQPASHAPGIYQVAFVPIIRALATATLTVTIAWTAPTVGAQSRTMTTISLLSLGTNLVNDVSIESTGATAITVTVTSGVVVGSALLDLYATAVRIATT